MGQGTVFNNKYYSDFIQQNTLSHAVNELEKRLGRDPTPGEIEDWLDQSERFLPFIEDQLLMPYFKLYHKLGEPTEALLGKILGFRTTLFTQWKPF